MQEREHECSHCREWHTSVQEPDQPVIDRSDGVELFSPFFIICAVVAIILAAMTPGTKSRPAEQAPVLPPPRPKRPTPGRDGDWSDVDRAYEDIDQAPNVQVIERKNWFDDQKKP